MKPKATIDLISTFRKKINIQFLVVLLVTISYFIFTILNRIDDPFFSEAIMMGSLMLGVASYSLFERRSCLFKILHENNVELIAEFEAYLSTFEQNRAKIKLVRLVIFIVLALVMVFLLIYFPHSTWTVMAISLWIGLIVLFIANRWILMNTHFMLQDLKRSLREGHSEISE